MFGRGIRSHGRHWWAEPSHTGEIHNAAALMTSINCLLLEYGQESFASPNHTKAVDCGEA
jgi:hypothetical protein